MKIKEKKSNMGMQNVSRLVLKYIWRLVETGNYFNKCQNIISFPVLNRSMCF